MHRELGAAISEPLTSLSLTTHPMLTYHSLTAHVERFRSEPFFATAIQSTTYNFVPVQRSFEVSAFPNPHSRPAFVVVAGNGGAYIAGAYQNPPPSPAAC